MRATRILNLLVGLSLLSALGGVASAEEVVLKAQTALPKTHDLSKSFLKSFVDKINVEGKGVIRVDYLGGPEINPPDAAPSISCIRL
jgi:hypothetical protein